MYPTRTSHHLLDRSHTVEVGMITYKGLPAPIICDFFGREASRDHYTPGVEFHIGRIDMVANSGTYVDGPFDRYADGKDLADLPLSSLANPEAIVIDTPPGRVFDDTADGARPVHSMLLAADIPIVEHMTGLVQLPSSRFRFFAVPVKVRAFGSLQVRAFCLVP